MDRWSLSPGGLRDTEPARSVRVRAEQLDGVRQGPTIAPGPSPGARGRHTGGFVAIARCRPFRRAGVLDARTFHAPRARDTTAASQRFR